MVRHTLTTPPGITVAQDVLDFFSIQYENVDDPEKLDDFIDGFIDGFAEDGFMKVHGMEHKGRGGIVQSRCHAAEQHIISRSGSDPQTHRWNGLDRYQGLPRTRTDLFFGQGEDTEWFMLEVKAIFTAPDGGGKVLDALLKMHVVRVPGHGLKSKLWQVYLCGPE